MVIFVSSLLSIGFVEARGAPPPLITICHNEQGEFITIEVKENKVQHHLDHGDYLGECSVAGGSTGSTGSTGEESEVEINNMYFVEGDLYVEWTEPVWNDKLFDSAEVKLSSKSQCQSSIFDSQEITESSESGDHQTIFNEILELLAEPVYVCVFVDSDDNGGSADSEDIESLTIPSGATGTTGSTGSEPDEIKPTGSKSEYDTRPTFGDDHNHGKPLVDFGFGFNDSLFEISDNHHTDFDKKIIDVGTEHVFSAKVYASKGLKVQEFLFGRSLVWSKWRNRRGKDSSEISSSC